MARWVRGDAKFRLRSKVGLRRRLAASAAAVTLVGGMGVAALASVGLPAPSALAAPTINLPCSGPSALVNAITATNNAGGGTIDLAPGCTYTLTSPNNDQNGLPKVTTSVVVTGKSTTIARSSAQLFRIFEVVGHGNLTLNGLRLVGGSAHSGGGILNLGTLELNQSQVDDNTAAADGGGISSGGPLTLTDTVVSHNTGFLGGGIITAGGATLNNSRVIHNTGGLGGGVNTESELRLNGSQVDDNQSMAAGGIQNAGTTIVDRSQVDGNTAARSSGGIFNGIGAVLTLERSEVKNNTAQSMGGPGVLNGGGGIFNDGKSVALDRSRVIGNTVTAPNGTSAQGGGIFNDAGTATLDRSTLTANRAVAQSAEGGGIFQAGGMVTLISGPVRGNKPDNCFPPTSVPTCRD